MVRLNFDYSNRNSSGRKLGVSIATDLRKKAERTHAQRLKVNHAQLPVNANAQRDANGSANSGLVGETTSSQVLDTARQVTSKIEIKVPGKALTDDGFAPIADALVDALQLCPEFALIELSIAGNNLSTKSFAQLAPIIDLAYLDLQTISIAENGIQVRTPQQVREWEQFLQSFQRCRTLRVLDLSNNPNLGHHAVETLARVYVRERPVDPISTVGNGSLEEGLETLKLHDDADDESNSGLGEGTILSYRAGLRALPYLLLQNIGLTDTGAMFVAAILRMHHYPAQLITPTRDTTCHGRISMNSTSEGIDWSSNRHTLGKDGLALLMASSRLRRHHVVGVTVDARDVAEQEGYELISLAEAEITSLGRHKDRQSSAAYDEALDERASSRMEYERARKRVERNVLLLIGPESVQLWHAALACLVVARKLYLCSPVRASLSVASTPTKAISSQRTRLGRVQPPPPTYAATVASTPGGGVGPFLLLRFTTDGDKWSRDDKYELEAEESSDEWQESSNDRKDSASDVEAVATVEGDRSSRLPTWQRTSVKGRGLETDGNEVCQLPMSVCNEIQRLVLGDECVGMLSVEQQKRVVEWGQWRGSLMTEFEWRGKDEGSQIWMLLEAMGCLSY